MKTFITIITLILIILVMGCKKQPIIKSSQRPDYIPKGWNTINNISYEIGTILFVKVSKDGLITDIKDVYTKHYLETNSWDLSLAIDSSQSVPERTIKRNKTFFNELSASTDSMIKLPGASKIPSLDFESKYGKVSEDELYITDAKYYYLKDMSGGIDAMLSGLSYTIRSELLNKIKKLSIEGYQVAVITKLMKINKGNYHIKFDRNLSAKAKASFTSTYYNVSVHDSISSNKIDLDSITFANTPMSYNISTIEAGQLGQFSNVYKVIYIDPAIPIHDGATYQFDFGNIYEIYGSKNCRVCAKGTIDLNYNVNRGFWLEPVFKGSGMSDYKGGVATKNNYLYVDIKTDSYSIPNISNFIAEVKAYHALDANGGIDLRLTSGFKICVMVQ